MAITKNKSQSKVLLLCCQEACANPKGRYQGSNESIPQAIELFRQAHLHGQSAESASIYRIQSKDEAHIHFSGVDCLLVRQREMRRNDAGFIKPKEKQAQQ